MPHDISKATELRAIAAFEEVLESAVPAYEVGQLHLFHDEDETYIQSEVERKLYEPQLPNGGAKERKIIERLRKLAVNRDFDGAARAGYAAAQWEKVLPVCTCHGNGCKKCKDKAGAYYSRKALKPKENKEEYKWYHAIRESAHVSRLWEQKWFAQLMLDGLPEPCSDFSIECKFLLRDQDGTVTRLVRLTNIFGAHSKGPHVAGCVELEADAFCAPEKFRRWGLSQGNFEWFAGVTELHKLQQDMAHDTAYRIVHKVESCGWFALGGRAENGNGPLLRGIWFYDECGHVDGKAIKPDDDGIIWYEGEGYFLCDMGRESRFVQGRPKICPDLKTSDCGFDTRDWDVKPDQWMGELSAFFREACKRYYETLNGYEGMMIIGSMLSFFVGPEIFAEYRFFSGLWVHGQRGSGKTSGVSWAMNIHGFNVTAGIALAQKTSTAVGILQQAENYSYQPAWLDEFRAYEVEADKCGILRSAYDRQMQAKWSPDGKVRSLKTNFIVSGETTSNDGATRNRFPHVQFSEAKRQKDHEAWFTKNAPHFVLFGRYALENRKQYFEKFRTCFTKWISNPKLKEVDDRARKVHGIVYAGWMAMVALLSSHNAQEAKEFEEFLVRHSSSAAMDASDETNINLFFQDMLTAFKADAIPLTCFRCQYDRLAHPPDRPGQTTGWKSYTLYIDPDQTLAHLKIFVTKQHGTVPLRSKDLRDQMSKNPYWKDGKLRQRFGPEGSRGPAAPCWGIYLDRHPLGYQPCTDEEHEEFLLSEKEGGEGGDPREGPLYAIIRELEKDARDRAMEAKAKG